MKKQREEFVRQVRKALEESHVTMSIRVLRGKEVYVSLIDKERGRLVYDKRKDIVLEVTVIEWDGVQWGVCNFGKKKPTKFYGRMMADWARLSESGSKESSPTIRTDSGKRYLAFYLPRKVAKK